MEKAKGISEIIQQNVKKGGKYIVFIPVSTDEKGKESKDKVKEYEERMREYLKDSGIDAEYYSMLGTYSDKKCKSIRKLWKRRQNQIYDSNE